MGRYADAINFHPLLGVEYILPAKRPRNMYEVCIKFQLYWGILP